MPYRYNIQQSGHPISIRNSRGIRVGTVPSVVRAAYSYRTGRKTPGTLALGESRLSSSSSVVNCLEAEQTAIRELNSELETSSVLREGTWGLRDAGHVFSRVRQSRKALHNYISFEDGWIRSESYDGAWLSPSVDAVTYEIMSPYLGPGNAEHFFMVLDSEGVYPMQDTLKQASELLWQTSPDVIKGSVGQDLVDLAQLPKLLGHLRGLGSALDSLKNKWGRLDRDVQNAVDLLFQRSSSARARQRALKRLRSLPKRSLSKGSSAYLEWEFVLSPYIEDIRLMLQVLGHLNGASIATSRRTRTSHEYRLTDSYAGKSIRPYPDYAPRELTAGNRYVFWPTEADCWRLLRYDISIHAKWARRGALLDPFVQHAVDLNRQLGVIYPSLLWDLQPWTFLIDWFLHIGTSIDRATYLSKGEYTPVYAWATLKGMSGIGWESSPGKYYPDSIISCPWPGMPVTDWLTRFPVSLNGGIKPQWQGLPSSARSILTALGFSRLK